MFCQKNIVIGQSMKWVICKYIIVKLMFLLMFEQNKILLWFYKEYDQSLLATKQETDTNVISSSSYVCDTPCFKIDLLIQI